MGLRASEESRRFYAGIPFRKQESRIPDIPTESASPEARAAVHGRAGQPRPSDGSAEVRVRQYFTEGRTA